MDTSIEKRERIVTLHLHTTKTQRQISEDLGVPQKTICRIIKHCNEIGATVTRRRGNCGRKRCSAEREDKRILRASLKNPRLTAIDIKKQENLNMSYQTVSRRQREGGRRGVL